MKSISLECSECGKFRVVSSSTEPIEYCPFCGDRVPLPNPGLDDEDDSDDLREFDPDDPDDE